MLYLWDTYKNWQEEKVDEKTISNNYFTTEVTKNDEWENEELLPNTSSFSPTSTSSSSSPSSTFKSWRAYKVYCI